MHESPADEHPKRVPNPRLVPQLGMMARALWASPVRNTLFLLSGALFVVVAVTAYGQIRLNNWNQPFYDALSHQRLCAIPACNWAYLA